MASEIRHLHLVGATGEIRVAEYNGSEHLVVPVVAMVEGVVWASNSDTPEFVPAEELAETPHQWDGRGCFAGHPKNGTMQVSANTPRILERSFGTIFETSDASRILSTRRLEMKAYLDPVKAEHVGPEAVDVIRRLKANERIEVSVGCYVEAEQVDGEHNGQEFHGIWRSIVSDHLAFLEAGETGACSVAAGCGAPRIAVKHLVTASGLKREARMAEETDKQGLMRDKLVALITSLRDAEGMSDRDVRSAVDAALRAVEPGYMGVDMLYPDDGTVIYCVMPEDDYLYMRRSYSIGADGKATLGETRERVEPMLTYKPVKEEPYTATSHPSVRREGGRWVVFSTDGTRRLGMHTTKADALAQEQAIRRLLKREVDTHKPAGCGCGKGA